MRKTNNKHWEQPNLDCLLFFAQSIDEMLFDYTLDSYKPLALNSRLLCIECLNILEEIKGDFMPKRNLSSIIEELKWSLNRDIAAKELLGKKFEYYLRQLNPNEIRLKELEIIINHIYGFFDDKKYLEQIKINLIKLIKGNKEKKNIKKLASYYVSELINYGYNPNQIYFQNNNFFFNQSKIIDKVENINDFFNIFDFEVKEFTVVFIGSYIFTQFKDTLNRFDIVVTKNYSCFSNLQEDKNFKKSRKNNESFIISSKIKDFDHHSAKVQAEKFLEQAVNLFNFYHHKQKPELRKKSVVARKEDNYVVVINEPLKSILKTKFEENPASAAIKVERVLKDLKLKSDSLYRFLRCVDLHSAALSTSAIENQILDLWASIETLIPKSSELNQDRIVQITSKLIPFLQINYTDKLFRQIFQDLQSWNKAKMLSILNKVKHDNAKNNFEKTVALITLKENSNFRNSIYNDLDDFPLLKFRIFELNSAFKSPATIKKSLNSHKQKLEWHLRRIYRTRSLIVHSGTYPSYTTILIEHLHYYLDIFLSKIIYYSSQKKFVSIEEIVLEMKINIEYHSELLEKHISEELTIKNYKEVILGIES
ncbi:MULTISPECIES: hypothetical protein [Chryseobacterium]|uniref:Apea-like HEPN domain-containing protein n=1 Tax=Chryseobacterium camelliae TaxID=1265445 RepID=A0ABU0TFW1_9FLAO|nr:MULTISPECIES: hypothetical protein [Chryseobacterium]MDT3406345.1 hypothetical protein [Pseudacidovorax intermedius]MDQ1095856.1 hypothetical protein [Chryseobacterium camelliae]MDQ1099792.1 hypothetical protein [Chryseobacterium sp. SORGH_AS_1048]MDR6087139.1 hypothetical protein [Chryseobacterium sp. SORGH_AS_0909]MDR6131512.1 hypothetical protein [Chryseobacterium sp. SORGH_AS_1175]